MPCYHSSRLEASYRELTVNLVKGEAEKNPQKRHELPYLHSADDAEAEHLDKDDEPDSKRGERDDAVRGNIP